MRGNIRVQCLGNGPKKKMQGMSWSTALDMRVDPINLNILLNLHPAEIWYIGKLENKGTRGIDGANTQFSELLTSDDKSHQFS